MKFDYINKLRYHDDLFTNDDYKSGQLEYLRHLQTIEFNNRKDLLRYFGVSFFHTANVEQIKILPRKQVITFELNSINTLEDINTFRKEIGLDAVSTEEYFQNPITYICTFTGVTQITSSMDLSNCSYMMDTEISGYNQDTKLYDITISFWEDRELSFVCSNCIVTIDKALVRKYTDDKRATVPYCEECNGRLLTPNKIKDQIERII